MVRSLILHVIVFEILLYLLCACTVAVLLNMSTRCCALKFCNNNATKITKWKKQMCTIHNISNGLGSCICEPPFNLYPFPTERKDPYTRKKWIAIVSRKNGTENWMPTEDSRVCSEHFIEGVPSALHPYPTLKLGYTPHKPITSRPPPRERSQIPVTPVKKRKCTFENFPLIMPSADSPPTTSGLHESEALSHAPQTDSQESEKIRSLEAKIKKLEISLSKEKSIKHVKKIQVSEIFKSHMKVKYYTGIPNVSAFNSIFQSLKPHLNKVKYWKGPKRICNPLRAKNRFCSNNRKLTPKEEMVLCLMKLRLGLLNDDLADRFGVSATHVSSVFTTWLKLLSFIFNLLVFNPPREIVKANLPPSFKNDRYKDVRHIIDCTEIFIEKPSNLQAAALTWSDYKHHNTVKILVSITPAGFINFVSNAWGGRTSDKHVTLHSGFLDLVEPFDKVLADRGFPISEDLTLRHAELLIPPGRRGVSQMSSSDVRKTKEIANRRIYIEQAIRRIKCFRILKYELPITLVQHVDNMIKIIAGICNLYPPLPRYE